MKKAILTLILMYSLAPSAIANSCGVPIIGNMAQIHAMENVLNQVTIGQPDFVHVAIRTLVTGGNLIITSPPGFAKSTTVEALAKMVGGTFARIQMDPDIQTEDMLGGYYRDPETGKVTFTPGPVFANIILIDEVNRTPTKTQNALMSPLAEGHVTIQGKRHDLPAFNVYFATQNAVDSKEGTYPISQAGYDRYLYSFELNSLAYEAELQLHSHVESGAGKAALAKFKPLSINDILLARGELKSVTIPDSTNKYIVNIVHSLRANSPLFPSELKDSIELAPGPRATLAVTTAAKYEAWYAGRKEVTREDVDKVLQATLLHRIFISQYGAINQMTPQKALDIAKSNAKAQGL